MASVENVGLGAGPSISLDGVEVRPAVVDGHASEVCNERCRGAEAPGIVGAVCEPAGSAAAKCRLRIREGAVCGLASVPVGHHGMEVPFRCPGLVTERIGIAPVGRAVLTGRFRLVVL